MPLLRNMQSRPKQRENGQIVFKVNLGKSKLFNKRESEKPEKSG